MVSSRQILAGFWQGEGKVSPYYETNASGEAAEPEKQKLLWYVLKIHINRKIYKEVARAAYQPREGLMRYFGEISFRSGYGAVCRRNQKRRKSPIISCFLAI